jgi:asparagine synthetase B (glutamine-hydrolysing)
MLCGYSWYKANRRMRWISRFLGVGRRWMKGSSTKGGRERTLRLERVAAGPGPERFQAAAGPLWSEGRRRLYSEDLARAIDANPPTPPPTPPELTGRHPVEWLQYWDITTRMHDHIVQTLDRHSMAWSVEVRVPFLDHEVAEWCLAMPPALKQSRPEKRVLRRALADDLPSEILRRPKRGLSGPSARWLRGALPPFVEALLSPESLQAKGWFDPERVAFTRQIHRVGRADRSRQLSAVLQVQMWDEIFLRGRSPDDFDAGPAA